MMLLVSGMGRRGEERDRSVAAWRKEGQVVVVEEEEEEEEEEAFWNADCEGDDFGGRGAKAPFPGLMPLQLLLVLLLLPSVPAVAAVEDHSPALPFNNAATTPSFLPSFLPSSPPSPPSSSEGQGKTSISNVAASDKGEISSSPFTPRA